MPKVLAFSNSSHKLTGPALDGGLPEGLVLQLWVRRTGAAVRQPIVALAAGSSRIVLGTGDRAETLSLAVIDGGKTQEVTVPGGLPEDRWVQVRAVMTAAGVGELHVLGMKLASGQLTAPGAAARTVTIGGGFVGELAQLQIWKHAAPNTLTWDAPPLDAPRLHAFYPLKTATLDAGSQQYVSVDAGPNKRHAASPAALQTIEHPESLADGGGSYLQFKAQAAPVVLSPVPGLERQLTVEAWVRPDNDLLGGVVELVSDSGGLVLRAGGAEGELVLLAKGKGETALVRATGLIKRGEWSHVAATVGVNAAKNGLVVSLFHQGVLRKEATIMQIGSIAEMGTYVLAHSLVSAPLVKTVRIGAGPAAVNGFTGGIAEVRIWQTAAAERVGAMWLARARGDEDRLLACYRLDALSSNRLVDVSRRRGWAEPVKNTAINEDAGPPIASTEQRGFRMSTRGKLVRERLSSSPPANNSGGKQTKILIDPKPIGASGKGDSCIFDATIEVAAKNGDGVQGRLLEVRVDEELIAITANAEKTGYATWAAGTTHVVALPASGKLRLRFVARALACPAIRVRLAGTSVWRAVCPDEKVQKSIRSTTAAELKSPADKRRTSPLPPGASDDDASALASAFTQFGSQFAAAPKSAPKPQARSFIDDLEDIGESAVEWGEDVYEDAKDTYEDAEDWVSDQTKPIVDAGGNLVGTVTRTAKSAGGLITRGAAEVAALAARGANSAVHAGSRAVAQLIDTADTIAVTAASTTNRWVEIVGTTIVDGTEVVWRAVVSGVDEALSAITAVVKRIGAAIEAILEFLAFLFAWDDFLAASDEALAVIDEEIDRAGSAVAGLAEYKAKLGQTLRTGVEQAIGKKSLGDLLGVDVDAASPVLEPMEYFMEYVNRALESASLVFEGGKSIASQGKGADAALVASATETNKSLPSITEVSAYLGTPVSQLLAGSGKAADDSSSLFDFVFDEVIARGKAASEQMAGQLRARMSVPWLTDFIEETILGGRKLTLARVVALVAAIIRVLTEKSSGKSAPKQVEPKATPKPTTKIGGGITPINPTSKSSTPTAQEKEDRRTRWIVDVSTALGIANSAVILVKTAQETGESASSAKANGGKFWTLISAGCVFFRGLFALGRIGAYPSKTRPYSGINAALEMVAGAYTFFTLEKEYGRTVDMAVFGVIGLGMTASSAIAIGTGGLSGEYETVSFSLRCTSWVTNSAVRVSDKGDDGDKTGRIKLVTGGLVVLSIAVDLTEAIYVNVNEVQSG
ncbi:LamG domain-containing protein [Nannocystis punicea]|uniref:LamG domain-containing protein n=1 Tax=Nannocystis punicea TaxID=2995304 RepID=A0ABY7H0G2_9BACT|nr:LamG domain-containing protein [Nannocystis poenicansa]WAS92615.1 LamG domain-containing protein [Nannocystis poenicansa]